MADANPGYPGLLYNLACCESLAGRTADAVEHLCRTIELSERYREFVLDDTDLDPIPGDAAFEAPPWPRRMRRACGGAPISQRVTADR